MSNSSSSSHKPLRVLDLFSGIGVFSLSAEELGFEVAAHCEIDRFASQQVLPHHWPGVPNLGDITSINEEQLKALGKIDLVTAGFPCTDLSSAGRRLGLHSADGSKTQSGLFYEATRIIRVIRPRWAIFENVPGLLSSKRGADFRAVLQEILQAEIPIPRSGVWAKSGMVRGHGCNLAWRIICPQHFGVPQRRRRVFIVVDFATNGTSAAEILLEQQSQGGVLAESAETGSIAPSITTTDPDALNENLKILAFTHKDYGGDIGVISPTLRAMNFRDSHINGGGQVAIAYFLRGDTTPKISTDICHTLRAVKTAGGSVDYIACPAGDTPVVRRLLPVENERLMGLPDGWSDTPHPVTKRPASDSLRYKAIGNSIAKPCADWIMQQLKRYISEPAVETDPPVSSSPATLPPDKRLLIVSVQEYKDKYLPAIEFYQSRILDKILLLQTEGAWISNTDLMLLTPEHGLISPTEWVFPDSVMLSEQQIEALLPEINRAAYGEIASNYKEVYLEVEPLFQNAIAPFLSTDFQALGIEVIQSHGTLSQRLALLQRWAAGANEKGTTIAALKQSYDQLEAEMKTLRSLYPLSGWLETYEKKGRTYYMRCYYTKEAANKGRAKTKRGLVRKSEHVSQQNYSLVRSRINHHRRIQFIQQQLRIIEQEFERAVDVKRKTRKPSSFGKLAGQWDYHITNDPRLGFKGKVTSVVVFKWTHGSRELKRDPKSTVRFQTECSKITEAIIAAQKLVEQRNNQNLKQDAEERLLDN